jgi:hypothetical protein
MENHNFEWVNQLQMAIFNSYVKLPEGKYPLFVSWNMILPMVSSSHTPAGSRAADHALATTHEGRADTVP